MRLYHRFASVALGLTILCSCGKNMNQNTLPDSPYANKYDSAKAPIFEEREADWRQGALVYQIIVDRFAPPKDLESKKDLYPAPKRLRSWDENPAGGTYVDEAGVWSHEIDFWGGDLQSLSTKLSYVEELGVDVVYLNPIHLAYTNHKYDAQDYFKVSPEYGTREDVVALAEDIHAAGMKFMLDGVFNHMGRTSPWFQEAMEDPSSPWREWYYIGEEYERGYRAWVNVENLPEINLESQSVRNRIYGDPDSVIQGYLNDGVDGWRLDVAFDIGFVYLDELTRAAHSAKPESLIIGEVWNWPEEWIPALDGVMNMTARELILRTVRGDVDPAQSKRIIDQMVSDTPYEGLLKSWIILDNHDTPRLRTALEEEWQQRMAQVLQFTLPGSPCIYYGVELGMEGGHDPEMRGPMRWDLVSDENPYYTWMQDLIALRNENRALSIGDYREVKTEKLLAFMRVTDKVEETILVAANPTQEEVRDLLPVRDSKVMNYAMLDDLIGGGEFQVLAGMVPVTIPPETIVVLRPRIERGIDYTPYKRVQ